MKKTISLLLFCFAMVAWSAYCIYAGNETYFIVLALAILGIIVNGIALFLRLRIERMEQP